MQDMMAFLDRLLEVGIGFALIVCIPGGIAFFMNLIFDPAWYDRRGRNA